MILISAISIQGSLIPLLPGPLGLFSVSGSLRVELCVTGALIGISLMAHDFERLLLFLNRLSMNCSSVNCLFISFVHLSTGS